ncbi:MAG: LysR family transcriptional regulator [Bradyrhizobium sp.]|nr:MAG: LysR family transcriptional regulator [Bradyrhizobium sp.]
MSRKPAASTGAARIGRRRTPPPEAAGGRLKLSHLRLIVAIADSGMVSAAAQAVGMSQPAASRMIVEIERLLKAPLCERLSRGVRLTPLGQALARHARSVLLVLAQAEREVADLRAGRRGVVSLGTVAGPAVDLVAPVMGRVRAAAPDLEVEIRIDSSNNLARELLASRLDFIIARVPDEFDAQAFESVVIGVEQAHLLVRRDHPLIGRRTLTLADVGAYEWVMQPRGTPLRRAVDVLFRSANIDPPRRFLTTTSIFLTMMLAASSNAIGPLAIGAARFASESMAPGRLAILKTDFSLVVQPYSLIAMRNRPLSPAAQAVYDIILSQALPGSGRKT